MAIYTWTGSTSTSWATAGNWSPAGPPVTADTAIIPASATNDLLTDLDRSGDAYGGGLFGLNLAQLQVVPGSTVTIGTATTPLRLTADEIIFAGTKDFYFSSEADDSLQPTDKIIIDSDSLSNTISIVGTSIVERIDCLRGTITVGLTAGGVTYAHVAPSSGRWYDVTVTFTPVTYMPTFLVIQDGTVYASGAGNGPAVIGGLILRGGKLVNNSLGGPTGNSFYFVYQTGGYFDYTRSGALATTPVGDPEIWLVAGTFDASRVAGYGHAVIGTIRVFPGGTFLKSDLLTITGTPPTGGEITIGE